MSKEKWFDKERAYILALSDNRLILSLPKSQENRKNKYLYVIGDIWDDEIEFPIRATWNHNFSTNQSRGNEILEGLGPNEKEKIKRVELQNANRKSYRKTLTVDCLRHSSVLRKYSSESTSLNIVTSCLK